MKKQVFTIEEAKKKLEYYCIYRDRSHREVMQKLHEMNIIPEAIDQIILHLIKENFLNEERFARSFVRGKFYQKKWGKNKIRQALKRHDIHPNLIEKAFMEIDREDYQKTIQKLIKKKTSEYREMNPYKLKQKISNYLIQKGYGYQDFSDLI